VSQKSFTLYERVLDDGSIDRQHSHLTYAKHDIMKLDDY